LSYYYRNTTPYRILTRMLNRMSIITTRPSPPPQSTIPPNVSMLTAPVRSYHGYPRHDDEDDIQRDGSSIASSSSAGGGGGDSSMDDTLLEYHHHDDDNTEDSHSDTDIKSEYVQSVRGHPIHPTTIGVLLSPYNRIGDSYVALTTLDRTVLLLDEDEDDQ
ncbi:hypothetical protein Pmar_PMAR012197, partial [Perkinsus marinus ATCC 50983]